MCVGIESGICEDLRSRFLYINHISLTPHHCQQKQQRDAPFHFGASRHKVFDTNIVFTCFSPHRGQ